MVIKENDNPEMQLFIVKHIIVQCNNQFASTLNQTTVSYKWWGIVKNTYFP